MNDTRIIGLVKLYDNFLEELGRTNANDDNEEMAFVKHVSTVSGNGMKHFLKRMKNKYIDAYMFIFEKTHAEDLLVNTNWNKLKKMIEETFKIVDQMSFLKSQIFGNTLLFMLRIAQRAIYKYRLYQLEYENDLAQLKDKVHEIKANLKEMFTFLTKMFENFESIDEVEKTST